MIYLATMILCSIYYGFSNSIAVVETAGKLSITITLCYFIYNFDTIIRTSELSDVTRWVIWVQITTVREENSIKCIIKDIIHRTDKLIALFI